MDKILLIGCGGHSKSVIDILKTNNSFSIYGLIGQSSEIGNSVLGYPVIGSDDSLKELRNLISNAFVCIGKIGKDSRREKIIRILEDLDFRFPTIISKFAVISSKTIVGEGTFIGHSAVVNVDSKIGKHCIINTGSVVEHDSKIDDNCHISTGALINGGVKIGRNSFIGSNAMIRENISLPQNTVISAGKRIMGLPVN